MKTYREVEDKFDVEPRFVLPSLAGKVGVASVDEPRVDDLVATYFDTADYRLARNRITLRRRAGGADAGWHLKLPSGSARSEIRQALGRSDRVPASLQRLVFARTRGLELSPVARLSTTRTIQLLRDAAGEVLAELADDQVHAQVFAEGGRELEISEWRELEVELVAGGPELLKQVGEQLVRGGARRSARPSKLGGVLGERLAAGADLPAAATVLDKRTPAGLVIQSYLIGQAEELISADLRVRLDEPESIHDMRVASRRIRSTLGSYRRLMDADQARDLEDRFRDLGERLGKARDSEVLLERLLTTLDEQPQTFVLGPVRRRLQESLRGEYLLSREAAIEFMSSAEYASLLDDLIAFVRAGAVPGLAEQAAKDVLPRLVRRRRRKVVRRVNAALETTPGEARDVALHQARKAAKQSRYAAEAAAPALGSSAARLAKRVKGIQEILGEHQDSIVAADVLRRLALSAHSQAEESAFTFGLLAGLESARAADTRRIFERAWKSAGIRGDFRD